MGSSLRTENLELQTGFYYTLHLARIQSKEFHLSPQPIRQSTRVLPPEAPAAPRLPFLLSPIHSPYQRWKPQRWECHASASGSRNEANTPVRVKGNGPSSLKHVHDDSHLAPCGTWSAGQTIESSSAVRVIESRDAAVANSGIGEPGARRQMAKAVGRRRNFRCMKISRRSTTRPIWMGAGARPRIFRRLLQPSSPRPGPAAASNQASAATKNRASPVTESRCSREPRRRNPGPPKSELLPVSTPGIGHRTARSPARQKLSD